MGEKSVQKKRYIVEKAREVFVEKGFKKVTMKDLLNEKYDSNLEGNLLLKQDSHLAIAGSIKARGGIYEILKHTEELALEHGFLSLEDNYEKLASEECREFFKKYTIQVGSTGNLGLSIGIMSAAVGYQVIVHFLG